MSKTTIYTSSIHIKLPVPGNNILSYYITSNSFNDKYEVSIGKTIQKVGSISLTICDIDRLPESLEDLELLIAYGKDIG